ncbi:hypothetical protein B9479_008382 [Cryptococcus floricola]|uniref:Uncharacterized protein n=1 Tax=Cryptococcus floricola TaxID=2591691 RepID=A0A5D3AKZ7_9TREE|nr:hypothetical protein B9479_008382 [Cryptococcus floricola]
MHAPARHYRLRHYGPVTPEPPSVLPPPRSSTPRSTTFIMSPTSTPTPSQGGGDQHDTMSDKSDNTQTAIIALITSLQAKVDALTIKFEQQAPSSSTAAAGVQPHTPPNPQSGKEKEEPLLDNKSTFSGLANKRASGRRKAYSAYKSRIRP